MNTTWKICIIKPVCFHSSYTSGHLDGRKEGHKEGRAETTIGIAQQMKRNGESMEKNRTIYWFVISRD